MHSNNVVHFAIHAEDVDRARKFYESVFGWTFQEWGPPDFYLIQTGPDENRGIRGALQKRTETAEGKAMIGFECSIAVENLSETVAAIDQHGGEIAVKEVEIPTVGRLVKFRDTEGNIACAIQYHQGVE